MSFIAPYQPQIYALLRIVSGLLFFMHGASKLIATFSPEPPGGLASVAMIIELIGGAMILIGFQASIAAFICSGSMAVAYFLVHQPRGLLPIQNQGELAALYAWIFLFIAARGSGSWSIDAMRDRTMSQ